MLGEDAGKKRLAENAFKMVHESHEYVNQKDISDINELFSTFERPVHKAVSRKKVLCPKRKCMATKEFFWASGIDHHFRIRRKEAFSVEDKKQSQILSRQMHEDETRECIQRIFEYRSSKVSINFFSNFKFSE